MRNATAVDRSKYQIVSALCDMAEKNNIIKKIIVFGSAASKKCSIDSDIDICYDLCCSVTDSRARNLSVATAKICDYNCDIVYYELIGANLRKEIEDKGVVVYEA